VVLFGYGYAAMGKFFSRRFVVYMIFSIKAIQTLWHPKRNVKFKGCEFMERGRLARHEKRQHFHFRITGERDVRKPKVFRNAPFSSPIVNFTILLEISLIFLFPFSLFS